jgi:Na+/H+-dicarboxylate symporter
MYPSMACLPAMVDASRALGVDAGITHFVVPLAAAMCRVGSAVGQTLAVLFAARLFNVEIGALQLAGVVFVTVLTTFTVPGIPGGSILVMVPVLVSAGVPAEAVGVLLGADAIPDMFRTMANVTGCVSAAAIVDRVNRGEPRISVEPA